jgi:phage shock protein PspC (stress-responsive transcriptional regulator)
MNRRFYRSRTDTILGGVAAGLANYLNADPALVRIAWAILTPLTGGAAFLAYIVAWIIVPEEPPGVTTAPVTSAPVAAGDGTEDAGETAYAPAPAPVAPVADQDAGGRAALVIGIGLVLLGIWFLVREYLQSINWYLLWPVALIVIGALILVTSMRRRT